jgi:cytoskeletal protein CcmA (bactofilin family)
MDQQNTNPESGEVLEAEDTSKAAAQTPPDNKPEKTSFVGKLKKLFGRFNVYLIAFIFILIVAGVIVFIAFSQNKKQTVNNPKSQGLSNSTLQQIAQGDTSVGGPQQVLNVESNAVFAGKVLVNQSLSVAGGLQVSGNVGFQNVNVSGNTQLQSANIIKDLTVGGNLGLTGNATINQNLQVNGNGTFSGTVSAAALTTSSLQLNGQLVLNHHLSVGGVSPTSTSGSALGSGGTSSVNGSDTAGAISIHIGGGPSAGCFITVSFNQSYNQTPYVIVSPVGQSAAGLSYYVNATTTNFSLCSSNAASANTAFSFDYFVVE